MIINGLYFSKKSLNLLREWQIRESSATYYIIECEKLSNWFLDNPDEMPDGVDILSVLVTLRNIKKDIATILEPSLLNQLRDAEDEENE